ncbi:RHS repeat domain-containing protein [Paraburkholderia bannensis]|uniref:hypothetical protein n=1 Tax=Paraburkholderia bannensis TaxID=765414 RepID=UPI002AC3714D|nr:hypothetical protein [Paraburkholderia bannensis]
MSTRLQPIKGNEAFWGEIQPTQDQINLMNKSPTLASQVQQANRLMQTGEINPIKTDSTMPPLSGRYNYETKRLQFPPDITNQSPADFTGLFSHEMGHVEYEPQNARFGNDYVNNVNARDPGKYNAVGMWSTLNETQGEYNNWKVGKEIHDNTATPDQSGIEIPGYRDNPITQTIDSAHQNRPTGLTDAQNENRLMREGMGTSVVHDIHFGRGTYDHDAHLMTGGAPTEPWRPVSANFQGNDTTGELTSATQNWQSGDTSTQQYRDGRLQSTQTVNPSGQALQRSAYKYNPDGSYGLTITDGTGRALQQSHFNADKSGTEIGYNADGSRMQTQFNGLNQTLNMTQYDSQGHETQQDHFNPDTGSDQYQWKTNSNGSHTLYTFNDQAGVGLQNEYSADGTPTATYGFDPDSGRMTYSASDSPAGSRKINRIQPDGTGTQFTVGRDGTRSPEQPVTYDQDARQLFDSRSKAAQGIAPPQPVGAENSLGNQKNYYDPFNNRLTNQVTSDPDGGKTINSYSDANILGLQVRYGADGRRSSAEYYHPMGDTIQKNQIAPDGSRTVTRSDSKNNAVTIDSYNPQNQRTQSQLLTAAGSTTSFYDPQTGQQSSTESTDSQGNHTVTARTPQSGINSLYAYDANGHPTSTFGYDPNKGTGGTYTYTQYGTNGEQTVDEVSNGQHVSYSVDAKGQQQNHQSTPLSPSDQKNLEDWKEAAGQPQTAVNSTAATPQSSIASTSGQPSAQQSASSTPPPSAQQEPSQTQVAADGSTAHAQQDNNAPSTSNYSQQTPANSNQDNLSPLDPGSTADSNSSTSDTASS